MNYQFCWYLFLRPLTFFIVVFLCAFTFVGITASATWLIIFGLIYPVAVSMRLHILSQKKSVMLRHIISEWIVYLPCIQVQEKQSALINVAFSSKTALRGFYIRALSSKVILHIITFYILWLDVQHATLTWYRILAALITLAILVKSMSSTLLMLHKVVRYQYNLRTIEMAFPWYEIDFKGKLGLCALFAVK
ncbi:TPA: hypothetical protein N2G15_002810 [Salmonella enterica]|nr:hypothetical protein [Salmonella enterica subsp. indica serovar 11:b:e,n,x]HBC0142152.1 hypothetical protein [Salmonella enterica subsp. indica serovar 11:b:e,n,x]HBC0167473.1 hypothetical protein [Salmonella enterica subsp. indica]HCL5297772.1 hypothetical protein [Salmonella enterica]